jgi:hypothetical protein
MGRKNGKCGWVNGRPGFIPEIQSEKTFIGLMYQVYVEGKLIFVTPERLEQLAEEQSVLESIKIHGKEVGG